MFELIDLHTHSTFSDGTLAPSALVDAASLRGVQVLALTDHDSTAGHAAAAAACSKAGIRFIPGVEITCGWRGQELHVVGLGVDAAHPALVDHLASLVTIRRARIAAIAEKLRRVPKLADVEIGESVLRDAPVPTRTHVARALVARGVADTVQQAFDRYLGRGCKGYVPATWPGLVDTVAVIVAAGGHATLAHPHRYKLSGGALRNLCEEFAACGGAALEVSLPGLSPADADRLARLARQHSLAGSAGSDFHEPGVPWRPLGRFAKLPDGIEPLLPRLLLVA